MQGENENTINNRNNKFVRAITNIFSHDDTNYGQLMYINNTCKIAYIINNIDKYINDCNYKLIDILEMNNINEYFILLEKLDSIERLQIAKKFGNDVILNPYIMKRSICKKIVYEETGKQFFRLNILSLYLAPELAEIVNDYVGCLIFMIFDT